MGRVHGKGSPAFIGGIVQGMQIDRTEVEQLRARLSRGKGGSLSYKSTHGRKPCACMSLKYNCKMDSGFKGGGEDVCRSDVGAEALLPNAAFNEKPEVVVKHWSAESKPWSDWWDEDKKAPRDTDKSKKKNR